MNLTGKNKARLAFEMLEKEFEVLNEQEMRGLKGGGESGEIIWAKDEMGNLYYKIDTSDTWMAYNMLQEVIVVGTGYGSTIKSSDFWSNIAFTNWANASNNWSIFTSGNGSTGFDSSGGDSNTFTTIYTATANSYIVDVSFTNGGGTSPVPENGGFLPTMWTSGGLSLNKNDNGSWTLGANLTISPPQGFMTPSPAGNIYIYVNGIQVGAMTLHDTSNDYPNGTISTPNTFNMGGPNGGFTFTNLQSGDKVEFIIYTGVTSVYGEQTNDNEKYSILIE